MPHHNTVFHGLLKQISRARFDRLVDQFKTDHRVRRLSSWTHFVTLLYGQLAQVQSLRGLECVIASHGARLYHLGVEPVRRSTLCDANTHRAPELFEALFASLLPVATPAVIEAGTFLRLIDATVIQLNGNAPWACYRDQGAAIKAHVVYDPKAAVPTYFTITPALTNDVVVRIQITIAMIAYLMIRVANSKATQGMQTLMKLVRTNLMYRKTIATLQKPPNQHYQPPNNQLILAFT